MIEKRIAAMLLTDTTITDAVGRRVTPVVMRQETELPALVYRRLDSAPGYTLAGRAGWRTVTLQIVCWAADYTEARTLAEAVRQLFDAYSETSSTGSIRFISVSDGADEYAPELEAFGAVVTLTIEYDDGAEI
jgi:hypothetical protein